MRDHRLFSDEPAEMIEGAKAARRNRRRASLLRRQWRGYTDDGSARV